MMKCWFSVSIKKQETVPSSLYIPFYPLCIQMLKSAKCSPSGKWGTYRSIAPDHHITPDCWSINGEQMNALLAPLYWNVSVWLWRAEESVAARPVSHPAGNELCLRLRYVTGWQDILYLLIHQVSIDVHVELGLFPLISLDFPDR